MNRRSQRTPAEFEQMAADNGISISGDRLSGRGPGFGPCAVPERQGRARLAYAIDWQEGDTRLSDFVQAGIEYMERNFGKKGFFMMVEGGKIDYAGHSNDAAACFQELTDMANSIDLARIPDPASQGNLILVTADHETGRSYAGGGADMRSYPELLAGQKLSIVGAVKQLWGSFLFPGG